MIKDSSEISALRKFIHTESTSGIVMITFAVLAVLCVNSPLAVWHAHLVNASIGSEPVKAWIRDILMVFFFLLIGLELKREICEGFLSKHDQIILPLCAAAGGMLVPAAIFFACNYHTPETLHGWAIPSATDIAFALAILSIFGKAIPPAVKIFLLAIAIFDDLGAIIIIAGFYNTGLALMPFLLALCGIILLLMLNRMHIVSYWPYITAGLFSWFCFHHCGIHTTLAGVAVGLAIPMKNRTQPFKSPVSNAISFLHPWVSFLVLPVFAFTNAGIDLSELNMSSLLEPLPLGIALGLFFGKQIGIFGTSWLLISTKLVGMPESATWGHLYAVSIIAGIGFTLSLFIGILAFPDANVQELVKAGVVCGSLLSIVFGFIVLKYVTKK